MADTGGGAGGGTGDTHDDTGVMGGAGRGRRSGRTRRFRVTWSRRGVGPSGGNGTTGQRKVPVTPRNNCNTPMSRGTQDNHATAWGRSSNSRAHRCRQSHRRGGRGGGGGSGSRARSTANRQSQKAKSQGQSSPCGLRGSVT